MKSLDTLVRDHLPEALRFAVRLTGDVHAAEDLLQESLLKVSRSWLTFRRESTFRTWLFRIVINTFRDQQRRTRRPLASVEMTADELADQRHPQPAEHAMYRELQDEITQRIDRLPSRQREIIVLVVLEQMSPRDAARVLGITETDVHSNLRHARNSLRKVVDWNKETRP